MGLYCEGLCSCLVDSSVLREWCSLGCRQNYGVGVGTFFFLSINHAVEVLNYELFHYYCRGGRTDRRRLSDRCVVSRWSTFSSAVPSCIHTMYKIACVALVSPYNLSTMVSIDISYDYLHFYCTAWPCLLLIHVPQVIPQTTPSSTPVHV